jgi:MSHA type pilus biogenesis protein MshL
MKRRWSIGSIVEGGLLLFCLFSIAFCSAVEPLKKTQIDIKREIVIPEEAHQERNALPETLKTPDFIPAAEDVTPLKTRIVNISARNTPLKDVLTVIAEATSLNLVLEKGVDPETPVNMTLKQVTADQALSTVFASVDYFYVRKGNTLFVRAYETRMFEMGQPSLTQKYSIDVGGDMLAGANSAVSSGGGGGGTGGGVKGAIEHGVKADETAFKFWDAVEKSIAHMLSTQGATASGPHSFAVNRLAGSIIVTGSKRELDQIGHYLTNLRKIIDRQVLVEAKIIEVQLNDNVKFGIDWNYVTGDLAASTSNFASVVPSSGPLVKVAISNRRLNPVLQALENQGDVRTLSNPRINIMNGQTALLSVGRNTSFISKVETTVSEGVTPITTYTVTTNSVLSGILIGIVPYINDRGEISLTVTPIVSNLVDLKEKTIGGQVSLSLPVVDLREMSTTVKVADGQTIVIGGLISKQESLQDNQVPFLGNLPFVGYLFKSRDKQQARSELVVLLQPKLITP